MPIDLFCTELRDSICKFYDEKYAGKMGECARQDSNSQIPGSIVWWVLGFLIVGTIVFMLLLEYVQHDSRSGGKLLLYAPKKKKSTRSKTSKNYAT
jgi:hypothetical protein